MLEKVKVGKNAKEYFAEMGEYSNMQDRLGGSNDVIGSPRSEEEHGKIQKQALQGFHEITEHNNFKCTFERIIFSFTCTPLDHSLTLEKTHGLQFLYSCFGNFAFAPDRRKICNCFIFDPGLVLFGSHLSVTSSGSGATRGVSGCHKQLGSANLNLTAARNQEGKSLEVTAWVYMVSDGNFVNTWKFNRWFTFLEGFHHIFCHEFFYS